MLSILAAASSAPRKTTQTFTSSTLQDAIDGINARIGSSISSIELNAPTVVNGRTVTVVQFGAEFQTTINP